MTFNNDIKEIENNELIEYTLEKYYDIFQYASGDIDIILRDNDFNIDKLNKVLKNNKSIKKLDLSKLHSILFNI